MTRCRQRVVMVGGERGATSSWKLRAMLPNAPCSPCPDRATRDTARASVSLGMRRVVDASGKVIEETLYMPALNAEQYVAPSSGQE